MKYTQVAQIESKTNPNKFYNISINEKAHLSCNCPAWIHQRQKFPMGHCKHIQEYLEQFEDGAVPKNLIPKPERKKIRDYKIDATALNEICGILEDK